MKKLSCFLFILSLLSCRDDSPTAVDTVASEYNDWYVLKAPADRAIEGVWGDVDKTVLISTMFTIYRTTDRGKSWQQVLQSQIGMPGIVQYRDTLFTAGGTASGIRNGEYTEVLIHTSHFSVDDGRTWLPYKSYNPAFEASLPSGVIAKRFLRNSIHASDGTTYRINRVYLDSPTATLGPFETPGVITSTGRRIDLPQLHQLKSLYLDSQERLYIAGSDAVCGQGQNFRFCNSQGGRGIVYVSRKPRP